MRETYSEIDVDHDAESLTFSVTSFGRMFDAQFSFDALDALIHELSPGIGLNCREMVAAAWQPELKDVAVELHRPGRRSLSVSAEDVHNRRSRRP